MEKNEIRKMNKVFMERFKSQVDGRNMLPYIILEDDDGAEVDGLVFTYTDDKRDNKPESIKVKNNGTELYYIFHHSITDGEYREFEELVVPNLAKEFLTTDLQINPI